MQVEIDEGSSADINDTGGDYRVLTITHLSRFTGRLTSLKNQKLM